MRAPWTRRGWGHTSLTQVMGMTRMFSHKLLMNAIDRIKFRFADRLRLSPARAVIWMVCARTRAFPSYYRALGRHTENILVFFFCKPPCVPVLNRKKSDG